MYAKEVTNHRNPAIAEVATIWNDMMVALEGVHTVWGDVPNYIMPLFSEALLRTLDEHTLLFILMYCYSPLALHTKCIGRLQSSEARGPDEQLTSKSWRYHEHGLTPELFGLVSRRQQHPFSSSSNSISLSSLNRH